MLKKLFYGFNAEREGKVYKKIGIHQFKKIVPLGGFWTRIFNKLFSQKIKLLSTQQHAEIWVIFTVAVEIIHFIGLTAMLYFMLIFLEEMSFLKISFLTLLNILINLYPIFVQRYNRLRILKTFQIKIQDLQNIKIVF